MTTASDSAAANADTDLVSRVLAAIRRVVPESGAAVALHEPEFAGREWDYVRDCLDSGWVSSAGTYVERFERALAERCGVSEAIATVNGTAALKVALQVAGVAPGDEVLVPALTFVATANAVTYLGAVPHFVDSETSTLGVSPAALEDWLRVACERVSGALRNRATGRRVRAVVPVHVFGHPVDMDALNEVAVRHRVVVVEDATEALGTLYRDRPAGALGRLAALSFNGNKIVTTGGGGAILTDDSSLARRARHLTTTARVTHRFSFDHDEVGYNDRLPGLNAALGCAQLERLDDFIARKRALARRYAEALASVRGVRFFVEPQGARANYWLNALLLEEDEPAVLESLLERGHCIGIGMRPVWRLMHRLPMYQSCPRMPLPTAQWLERRLVNLPSSAALADV